jgi:hypothetical protein
MSATAEKLQERMEDLPEGSTRRRVLECARRFKSSWVDLGRMLNEVRREGLWREWGHASFEAYCTKELFIRKQTAEKLTMSYAFMERHEPALVRRDERESAPLRPVPSFEVIDVLSRAEAAGRLDERGWREIRDDVLERPTTPAVVNRQLTQRYGAPPPGEQPPEEERLRKLAALAARVAAGCDAEDRVPRAVAERMQGVAEDLAALARKTVRG